MSQLEVIAGQLRALAQSTGPISGNVQAAAGRLRSIASRLESIKRSGIDTRALEGAILTAEAHAQKAADAVRHVQSDGTQWADQLATRVGGDRSGPANALLQRMADRLGRRNPRYIHPGKEIAQDFSEQVALHGNANPAQWIAKGNPLYRPEADENDPWANNCGSCSRSFADAYQDKVVSPAMGDSRKPPGEYSEMWTALDARPNNILTKQDGQIQPFFTRAAYRALETELLTHGPGSVAIVGIDWDAGSVDAGGHWFNAFVDHSGNVHWADLQTGETNTWPPDYALPIKSIEAVVRRSKTDKWKGVTL